MKRQGVRLRKSASSLLVTWDNGTRVVFGLDRGKLLGIREVSRNGIALRSPAAVWRPFIDTPDGIHYVDFRLRAARAGRGGIVRVEADAIGFHTGVREEQDEYMGDVIEMSRAGEMVVDRLVWELRPSTLTLDGCTFDGFSYVYRFLSRGRSRKIYRLFDMATWEIGGQVDGNTIYSQTQTGPPVVKLSRKGYYTTACNYYGAELRGIMGPPQRISFQRLPRMGTLQAFDFLVHDRGVLFAYFDPLIEVMSVIQKEADERVLHFVDEIRRPLASRFETAPKHILFLPTDRPLSKEEAGNLWCRAYDFVHGRERARHGIEASPVLPRVWVPQIYGAEFHIGKDHGPRDRLLYYLADNVLPQWADMGVKEICVPSFWVSDYTVDRLTCKDQTGLHGGLFVGSICCVRVHEIDPLWGGTAGLAYFVDRAHRLQLQVQLWWATHLSRRAPIFAERPDFMLIARDGLPNGGGYGHHCIITMNLANPDCLEWEYDKLRAVYEATGFDGFFHDSYGNMTFLPVNYADPERRGQQEAYATLVARLQKLGVRTFTVEGLGPWGVGHFGMGLLPTAPAKGLRYQNALDWWLGHEDMIYRLNMGIATPLWPGRDQEAREFSFRCLAYGGRFGFTGTEGGIEKWTGWLRDQNRMYGRIAPLRGKRILLPDDRGVLWELRRCERLLFAFRSFEFALAPGETVGRITGEGEEPCTVSDILATAPWSLYRLTQSRYSATGSY